MKATVLVVTTVHHPDDTRIRQRLISTLAAHWDVVYACREPGPSKVDGFSTLELRGGRAVRWFRAGWTLLTSTWDIAVLHDSELIPLGVVARTIRRKVVVFDVHENLRAQVSTKSWIPGLLKPAARALATGLYWLADRLLTVTLAEPGYSKLFSEGTPPVFANYPMVDVWPEPQMEPDAPAIYVGDVSISRGVWDAVEASGQAGIPLLVVGPVTDVHRERLLETASRVGCDLRLAGRVTNPEALQLMASAAVGLSPLYSEPNYVDSLPTKVIEYLSVGIPVAASDLPGTRSVVGDLEAVYLHEPGNVSSMASAMTEARSDDSRRIARDAASEVRSAFSWPADEVVAFYQGLLTPGENPTPN